MDRLSRTRKKNPNLVKRKVEFPKRNRFLFPSFLLQKIDPPEFFLLFGLGRTSEHETAEEVVLGFGGVLVELGPRNCSSALVLLRTSC